MILDTLLGGSLSPWEEKLVAAIFLSGESRASGFLPKASQKKVNFGLEQIGQLHSGWAKELCWDVLLSIRKKQHGAENVTADNQLADRSQGGPKSDG